MKILFENCKKLRFVFIIACLGSCGPSEIPVDSGCYQLCVGNNLASKAECRRRCASRSLSSLAQDGGH